MFKIKKITIDGQSFDFDDDCTVIYAPNTKGKSLLFKIIHYMLGSRKGWGDVSIWDLDGMKGINEITMEVSNGKSLYLKRNREGGLFSKNDEKEAFMEISIDYYKEQIQSMLISSDECFPFYKKAVGDDLTFRAFSYLNFIDQYGLGNAFNVFSQSTDVKQAKRIRRQMRFFFDSENLVRLVELEKERDALSDDFKKIEQTIFEQDLLKERINSEMRFLEIENPKDIKEKKACFETFCKNRIKQTKPENKEYAYLLAVRNQLANQIQIEKTFSKQRELIRSRNKKNRLLLRLLQNSIGDNPDFNHYLSSISETLNFIQNEDDVLSYKDYDASISAIEKKKEEVDSYIDNIECSLSDKTESDVSDSIKTLAYLFKKYEKLESDFDVESLKKRKDVLDERIRELEDVINAKESEPLNRFLSDAYSKMPDNIAFVRQDKEESCCGLEFVPSRVATIGKKREYIQTEKGNEFASVNYLPGSKARQACWQIITFVGMHWHAKRIYPSLPLLPILVIDGINEPFDNSFGLVFDYLSELCSDQNIQLICVSTEKAGKKMIDLSAGLNPRISNAGDCSH